MSSQYIGPLYGPLPDLEASWAYTTVDPENDATVILYTPEDMREMIREMQDLRTAYDQLSKLSIAMNSLAALSPRAQESVKKDVVKYVDLKDEINLQLDKVPEVSPDGLPIIKADVIEYSEEPLKQGKNYVNVQLQTARERLSRLQMSVCRTLDLCAFDLNEAICCSGPGPMHGVMRGSQVPLYRS